MLPSEVEFDVTDEAAVASLLSSHGVASRRLGLPAKAEQQDVPQHFASFGSLRTRRS